MGKHIARARPMSSRHPNDRDESQEAVFRFLADPKTHKLSEPACRDTGCRVLASAALLERIGALPAGVTRRSPGPLPIRGKEQPIALYALKTMDGTE